MEVLISDNGTHAPEKWTESLLSELVRPEVDMQPDGWLRIEAAKSRLRPIVVEMISAMRNSEILAYTSLTNDEKHAFSRAYNFNHGTVKDGPMFQFLQNETTKNKIRSGWDWAEQHVKAICRTACEIHGHIPSEGMKDEVYRILSHWFNSVIACERSHFVSHNHLQSIGV